MSNEIIGTKRNSPPFRYDIVGSFLRTDEIKIARKQYNSGEINAEELKNVEDIEIRKLIEKEKEIGLIAVTDGEFRRSWWHLDFFVGIEGTKKIILNQGGSVQGSRTKAESFQIVDKIRFNRHPMLEHFKYLNSIVKDQNIAKFTIPSPSLFHFVQSHNKNNVYSSDEELMEDIISVYKSAIKEFYDAGCRYLQLDDTAWGTLCSERHRSYFRSQGIDPEALSKNYVRLINESIKEKPEDMIITLHVCRGNLHSIGFASGGYEPIAEELFSNAKVDGFFLEYDSERCGDFKPLRFINDQFVVLGVVTTKHGGLESKEQLKNRIAEASQYVDINKLCLSPQCGFASTEEGNIITEEEQWEKIKLVIETANEIWKL
ncbi:MULTISPECIES: 5-methyltetrahydropteroyltriglutamate--homocysteine S-methyltransferase [Clostridium]|uniref:5-methyltetrahydropteroyltriglutamate--homocysteine methyltransferase n=2 Tax=Clostridium TaxID=1485 RepID=A0A9Q5CMG2_CLOBE|nr:MULTISPECIES: 5-methyltetrahydropteroyltriglutamate--homocysteine S-methyltransferase [Clostridium]AQS05065.1 5-methyltetrahydropteroyltriglutamate--homocysteine methyltransferase [Clostridium beijerinckii]MBA2886055.1 5-methyltetrahydropteroyltriglutamate--homocysteine methyltransferase [Clostridium beijerinckii]MBA2900657.1 5-methyltetrahydropteroyltriglutamate--homocysteine methyltransferase [Clostridium beijerinckii]MBA2910614.1 5-methyltetrahydropteroyltriglutamate--homocysteine methylt